MKIKQINQSWLAMKNLLFAAILSLLILPGSVQSDSLTLDSLCERMMNFYTSPSKAEFDAIQRGFRKYQDKVMEKRSTVFIIIVFLARVHEKYDWPLFDIGELDDHARSIAAQGKNNLSRYVNDDSKVDPTKLDIWWVSFFATGETLYLDKIVQKVGDLETKTGTANIVLTGAANWSFTSNCKQHPAVLQYAKSLLKHDLSMANRQMIQEIVNKVENPGS